MAFASAPILPVGGTVDRVVYRGFFVKALQQALVEAGYDVGEAGIDGLYGPDTAAALKAFQDDHPEARELDQLPGYIPYQVAGCHTYRALGLDVWTSYCRGGVSADGDTCDRVMAADAHGLISLKCVTIEEQPPEVPHPRLPAPSWLDWRTIALVAGAGLVMGAVGYALARRR